MNRKKARKLFKKYVNDECSPQEEELLHTFLDSFQNKTSLRSELSDDQMLNDKIWQKIESKINSTPPKKKYPFRGLLKYAAVIVCILGVVYIWNDTNIKKGQKIYIPDNAIILRTANNTAMEIVEGVEETIVDAHGAIIASQRKNQIVYQGNPTTNSLIYNEIEVPKGKTFQLVLSDGTLVHLNSDTSLKFPVNFMEGENRKVFLKGEAYFEVTNDPESEFTVVSNQLNVKVLGTHFNLSSYADQKAFAVLVEGSVAVQGTSNKGEKTLPQMIKPGQKASFADSSMDISNVDVGNYLGWREGKLAFNDEPFKDIIKKIERRYNVAIDNNYTDLESVKFRGTFENETIEDLLNTFKESAKFDYVIAENRIQIKKPKRNDINN